MASRRPDLGARIDRVLAPLTWLAAALVVLLLFLGPELIGAKKPAAAAAPRSGEEVFAASGCGGCHTLAAAGATGASGPNLDDLRPAAATVAAVVRRGEGTMPAFGGSLSPAEVQAVAEYVASSAGR
jgi:mono/diheme cytochrome c family protein